MRLVWNSRQLVSLVDEDHVPCKLFDCAELLDGFPYSDVCPLRLRSLVRGQGVGRWLKSESVSV